MAGERSHGREDRRAGSGLIRWMVAACLVSALPGCNRTDGAALPADGPDARLHALAEAGDAGAMTVLRARYPQGAGPTREPAPVSVKRNRHAADLGVAEAQFDVARALERGDGTAPDLDRARGWYLAAATQGHAPAGDALARVDLGQREPAATGPARLPAMPPPPEPDRPTPVRLVAALPPVPPLPAPPSEAVQPHGAGFVVHLASYREPEQAVRGWAELQRLYGDLLGGLEPAIAMIELGDRGIFFRLLAGGFDDRADAQALCAALAARGAWCQTLDAEP